MLTIYYYVMKQNVANMQCSKIRCSKHNVVYIATKCSKHVTWQMLQTYNTIVNVANCQPNV